MLAGLLPGDCLADVVASERLGIFRSLQLEDVEEVDEVAVTQILERLNRFCLGLLRDHLVLLPLLWLEGFGLHDAARRTLALLQAAFLLNMNLVLLKKFLAPLVAVVVIGYVLIFIASVAIVVSLVALKEVVLSQRLLLLLASK